MNSRIAHLISQLPSLESALQSFTTSSSKFRIVQTVSPTTTRPKTLYILDSSFNPPSSAHLALTTSAFRHHSCSEAGPYHLLLLFSTHNADKMPNPAHFAQRLALMTLFAEDILHHLTSADPGKGANISDISIDVGLTKEPYYSDKSAAIAADSGHSYESNPIHVHLMGFDTFIRFCNPKYYPEHDPPLSALRPYFEAGHKICVIQRPSDPLDVSSREFGTSSDQETFLDDLRSGAQTRVGFESAWTEAIKMLQAHEGAGVSSTRVRNAAEAGKWNEVKKLCTESVAAWVQDQDLYGEVKRT